MTASAFATLVLLALALSTCLRYWLGWRHIGHVVAHRECVPTEFAAHIAPADHRKAADYTVAKVKLGMLELAIEVALFLALTFGGVIKDIDQFAHQLSEHRHVQGLLLFAGVALIGFAIDLPASLYRTFRLEARFGFNKTTAGLWWTDLVKSLALSVLIGAPLLWCVLWLMEAMGESWWLYVWMVWLGFNVLILLLYPTVIAPLFNKFTPLQDDALKARIEALLQRCGFSASGLFVMDGSKRSAHGNAYFTGFGAARRIVFFDTLIEKLTPAEIEAVLAHELGHFHHRHVAKRIVLMSIATLGFLALLGQLIHQPWVFEGLKVGAGGTAMGLLLFSMVLPWFLFPLAPLGSMLSRRHEYQADAYAARQTDAADMVTALVKLYRDNAATLTPDPLHSLFYDSHPPASQRIAHLGLLGHPS